MTKGNGKYLQMAAYVMLTAIFVLGMGVARNCNRLSEIGKEGFSRGDTIDIALLYGPGSYYMYDDSLGGINMKIADIFSEETSIPVKIWPITEPASGLARIEDGAFDILASLPLDNDIKKNFNVSESIFLDRLVLVQLTDSASGEKAVKSSLDLNGKTVYVAEGSSAVKRMQNLSEEIGGTIKVEQVEDMSDELLCLQVASGTLPLAVVNERIAAAIAKKYPGLSYESTISFTQFQVWVFNKGDTLLYQKFNSWFETFSQSPRYREILNKY